MSFREVVDSEEFRSVVRDYRQTCLWFANDVCHPQDEVQLEQVLSAARSRSMWRSFRACWQGDIVFVGLATFGMPTCQIEHVG